MCIRDRCYLPTKGYYFKPTVFTGVTQSHRIAKEEIFGPVLSVLTFRTLEEAVEKANNTMYGLSAGVWTDKGSVSYTHLRAHETVLDLVCRLLLEKKKKTKTKKAK